MSTRGMDAFQAIIHSLGEHLVTSLGRESLESLTIVGDEVLNTADVHVTLQDGSWSAEERAIDTILDVLPLFDEDGLHVSYCFVPESVDRIEQKAGDRAGYVLA